MTVIRAGLAAMPARLSIDGPVCYLGPPSVNGAVDAGAADGWEAGIYVSAGWIDLHCHVFEGVGSLGVATDRVGLVHGVHHLVDAGSAGAATIDGFREHVVERSDIPVSAWLNVSTIGLITGREFASSDYLDVEAGVEAFQRHGDILCGIKVRSCGEIVGDLGLTPLKAALELADRVGRPLMVHIGRPDPRIDSILPLLRDGDVVTHCFHGKPDGPWDVDGGASPALRAALARGVLLDVGHGAASFDPSVAQKAIAQGCLPHTVSTDIHARSIDGPVYSMAHVMATLGAAGMSLDTVVDRVTDGPAKVLGLKSWLAPEQGPLEQATVFRVHQRGAGGADSEGPTPRISVLGVVTDGRWRST